MPQNQVGGMEIRCLDIGHANLVRENPDEFIKELGGKRLKCLHVYKRG